MTSMAYNLERPHPRRMQPWKSTSASRISHQNVRIIREFVISKFLESPCFLFFIVLTVTSARFCWTRRTIKAWCFTSFADLFGKHNKWSAIRWMREQNAFHSNEL
jgi:hypothetical protein